MKQYYNTFVNVFSMSLLFASTYHLYTNDREGAVAMALAMAMAMALAMAMGYNYINCTLYFI